jgi:hypothetical protein
VTPAQIVEESAARIRVADQEAHDAAAAFQFGRFPEYWRLKADALMKRLEETSDESLARVGDNANPAAGTVGPTESPENHS